MRRRARDYASRASWVPGENISVVQRGGVKGSHTLNAAGMQMFVNCVSNLGRLPTKTLQELYNSLTGNKHISRGHSYCCSHAGRGAHKNCATVVCNFDSKELAGSIYTGKCQIKLAVGNSGAELAVGNPEKDLTALPDTLPVVVVRC